MKFSTRAVSSFVAAAAALSTITMTTSVDAAPIATCGAQYECLDWTFECITSPICESECEYRVCMKLNLNKPGCDKSASDTVSHTCEKPEDQCMPNPGEFRFVSTEVGPISNGYDHCQVVPPGGMAEFLLKDGNANPDCGFLDIVGIPGTGGSVMCETYPVRSCTGNGNVGKECVWKVQAPSECDKNGGPGGDPHIKLWNRTRYSYHGECDLVVVENKDFADGLGMDIHIRTTHKPYITIPSFYSFIESAAIRIGDDVLEFTGDDFYINGVQGSDTDLPTTIAGFPLQFPTFSKTGNTKYYQIDLNNGDKVVIHKYSHFMTVDITGKSKDFGTAVGLLGDYHTSAMLARDGMTILHNADGFGSEWQVRENEPKLFRSQREPIHPHAACKVPEVTKESRDRHLRMDTTLVNAAETACAQTTAHDFEFCVHDVLATRDVGMAEAW